MSKFDITNIARNLFVNDTIEAISKVIKDTEIDFSKLETTFMLLADNYTVELWEKFFNLSVEKKWTLEDRINRLVYTFNSRGFFTRKFLTEQAKVFTNGDIEIIESPSTYHFKIKFVGAVGLPPNLDNFKHMIEVNKPAHLTWELEFTYRTHRQLQVFRHSDLNKYTHKQLRELKILN